MSSKNRDSRLQTESKLAELDTFILKTLEDKSNEIKRQLRNNSGNERDKLHEMSKTIDDFTQTPVDGHRSAVAGLRRQARQYPHEVRRLFQPDSHPDVVGAQLVFHRGETRLDDRQSQSIGNHSLDQRREQRPIPLWRLNR